jgi:hypothetical protein
MERNTIEEFSSIADFICRYNCKEEKFIIMMIHSMDLNNKKISLLIFYHVQRQFSQNQDLFIHLFSYIIKTVF